MRARHLSLSIHAARKPLKRFLPVIRSVRPGWLCTRMVRPPMAKGGSGRNTAAPSASPKPVFALVTTKTGTTARGTGDAPNIRPFQQTTDFPLTGNACILSVSMPCVQSVSVITPALRHLVKKGSGFEMAAVLLISTHWLISLP